jgi:transposase
MSTDPLFVEKVYDVVGLYLNPPENAVVLCVGEKSQVQALARSQPVLPMMPGMPEKRTHDYVCHGTTSLFAAFNIADGTVISALHRRHRAAEFKKFLSKIDAQVPAHLDIHVIADNYGTHKTPAINAWLARHPRFHMHFTPTSSSWINQVERWFGFITEELIRRGHHTSVRALENDIRSWVQSWNTEPRPFIWTKCRTDPQLTRTIYGTNYWRGTLAILNPYRTTRTERRQCPTTIDVRWLLRRSPQVSCTTHKQRHRSMLIPRVRGSIPRAPTRLTCMFDVL